MEILDYATQLGMALADSKEVIDMHEAEAKLDANLPAIGLLKAIEEAQKDLQQLMMDGASKEDVDKASQNLRELDATARKNEVIMDVQNAQEAFSALMNRINNVLRFYITGEETPADDGCSGSCSGCAGCN